MDAQQFRRVELYIASEPRGGPAIVSRLQGLLVRADEIVWFDSSLLPLTLRNPSPCLALCLSLWMCVYVCLCIKKGIFAANKGSVQIQCGTVLPWRRTSHLVQAVRSPIPSSQIVKLVKENKNMRNQGRTKTDIPRVLFQWPLGPVILFYV